MLNNDVKTTLDNIVQAVDTKIDKRLDAMEIAKKKAISTVTPLITLKINSSRDLKKM